MSIGLRNAKMSELRFAIVGGPSAENGTLDAPPGGGGRDERDRTFVTPLGGAAEGIGRTEGARRGGGEVGLRGEDTWDKTKSFVTKSFVRTASPEGRSLGRSVTTGHVAS